MKLKWNTKKNFVDCGVFLMRHMECYEGQKPQNWDCSIPKETEGQSDVIFKLRIRYNKLIQTHEANNLAADNTNRVNEYGLKGNGKAIAKAFSLMEKQYAPK